MFLSIIVCTYNRDQHIGQALKSLTEQDFNPEDFEIVIIDNNSTDKTSEIIENFKINHPSHQIKIFKETKQGLAFARNKGIKESDGNYVSFIDDDAIAEKDFVRQIKENATKYQKYMAFGGKVLPKYEEEKEPKWMSKYIERIISIVDMGNEVKEFKKSYPVGCNMFFKKELLNQIGNFDEKVYLRGEDKEIFYKIKRAGHRVLYTPDVVVWHFIDAYRTSLDYVTRISWLNGKSEHMRISALTEKRNIRLIFKFIDYFYKINAALLLWIYFWMKSESIKGKFLFVSMISSLSGFIKHKSK